MEVPPPPGYARTRLHPKILHPPPKSPPPPPRKHIKRQSKLLKHDGKWGLIVIRSFFETESHRKIKWVAKRVGEDKHIKNGAGSYNGDKITTGIFREIFG